MSVAEVCVSQLIPGDVIHSFGRNALYISQTNHPIFPGFRLVIWKLDNGSWSHDALDSQQVVGERVQEASAEVRQQRLRAALLGASAVEHREDRAYDEQDPSSLVMPSGTLVASYDRAFLAAAGREVLALHLAARGGTDERTQP